jgi:hypothetical protein
MSEKLQVESGENWQNLATEVEQMKVGEDRVIDNLVRALRKDPEVAKILCNNETDKFSAYRETIVPLLIQKLYGGSGSPWPSVERKMKQS